VLYPWHAVWGVLAAVHMSINQKRSSLTLYLSWAGHFALRVLYNNRNCAGLRLLGFGVARHWGGAWGSGWGGGAWGGAWGSGWVAGGGGHWGCLGWGWGVDG